MIRVDDSITLQPEELEFSAVRAGGPGGQHVNTTSSAVQLRFDIRASSLPEAVKARLLSRSDQRITDEGVIIIKAREERSQERNRQAAIERLVELIKRATHQPKKRIATKPSKAAKQRRVDGKTHRGKIKSLRGRVQDD